MKPLLKKSLNLEAETLVRALGLRFRGEGTFAKGKETVEETRGKWESEQVDTHLRMARGFHV